MFSQPKKTKYRKVRKGRLSRLKFQPNGLLFGTTGLKARASGVITARQIEAARRAIARKIKRKGKVWTCVFPDLPLTSKPVESRMGKGKGSVNSWGTKVRRGTILFEICGVPPHVAAEALLSGSNKLAVKTQLFD